METVYRNDFSTDRREAPKLSLIVPCYKVDKYLATFFHSLDAQKNIDRSEVEFVFVIDGCPNGSAELATQWAKRTSFPVTVVEQENKGLSEARNTGIRHALGEFVSFPDPDDEVDEEYLFHILNAINRFASEDMFVARICLTSPAEKAVNHPLDYKYRDASGPRLVSLVEEPEMIHLQSATTILRKGLLETFGLTFSPKLRTNFEDGHLLSRFLMRLQEPRYVLVPDANYFYKQRDDGSSLVATNRENYEKYITLCESAYLPLLEESEELTSSVPVWLSNIVLYELWWLFRASIQMQSPLFALSSRSQAELFSLIQTILGKIGTQAIHSFRVVHIPETIRHAWLAISEEKLSTSPLLLGEYDKHLKMRKVFFFSSDPNIPVDLTVNRKPARVAFRKARFIEILERVWVYEIIMWVSCKENEPVKATSDSIHFLYFGNAMQQRMFKNKQNTRVLPRPEKRIWLRGEPSAKKNSAVAKAITKLRRRAKYAAAVRLAAFSGYSKKFRQAWVLMDRDSQAHDNAEALYRYIQKARPEINAWFTVNRTSADYRRLKAEGFKVVPFRSIRHYLLMKQAVVLASSQADHYVLQPFEKDILLKEWAFVFLQHGVIHNRLDRWLNPKDIQLFLTSTEPEYESIAGDISSYKYSTKEVVLSGLPRTDHLYELVQQSKKSAPTVMIMPTWRNYLLKERVAGGNERVRVDNFYETEFVREWEAFLNSEKMQSLAKRKDLEVVLLPHPNIDHHWKDLSLPKGITRLSYTDGVSQEYLARAQVAITDYSSQAFEAAFVGAPTVYFQFDRELFFQGTHIASPGYFNHFDDGFGPVCMTSVEATTALLDLVENTHPAQAEYQERINSLYKYRDNNSAARATDAIASYLNGSSAS